MPYNPALDGLRAFAIFLVAMFHTRAPWGVGGYIGVDVFFVLSGFLITTLLLGELESSGRIDLIRFWRRRVRRLTPALLTMLAVFLFVGSLLWRDPVGLGQEALVAALYLADYGMAWWGTPTRLSHMWSLAVEAHFYLLWPLVLMFAHRRWKGPALVRVLLVTWLLATAVRWACTIRGQSWSEVYYRTDTHMSGLLLGAWLGAALRERAWRETLRAWMPWLLWLPVGAILCLRNYWGDLWMQMWGISLAEWATVPVLVALQRPGSEVARMFSLPVLAWLGRLSYGVYLWHFPIFVWMRSRYTWDVVLLVGGGASVALAAISYFTVEAWAVRRRVGPPMTQAG